MYARNLLEMVKRMVEDGSLAIDVDDAVIGPAIVDLPEPEPTAEARDE